MSDLISRKSLLNKINAYVVGSQDKEFICKLIKEMSSVESEGEWIPVSERMPEYYEEVLTYHEDDEEYQINWVTDDETGEWFYENPTAWMPLPEPYKAESEEENGKKA